MPKFCLFFIIFATILFLTSNSYTDTLYTFQSDIVMQAVPTDSGAFFEAELINTGDQRDTYTVIKLDNIPDGWFAVFCIDSLCLSDSGQVSLDPSEMSLIKPDIFPQLSPGDGEVTMRVISTNNPDDIKEIAFLAVSGYQTLLVNHSLTEDQYRLYYEDALISAGIDFNYWDHNFAPYRYTDLINFRDLIIYSGDRFEDIIGEFEMEVLINFLNSGNNIFLTGQGLASSLGNSDFIENVLGVMFIGTHSGSMDIDGIDNDPIGGGLHFSISGGDGADNQVEPDIIETAEGAASVFAYSSDQISGARFETNGYKVVFLAFGFEAVDDSSIRSEIISRSFDWFNQSTTIDGKDNDNIPAEFLTLSNYPNPFNSQTTIWASFQDHDTDICRAYIEILDVLGRKVSEIAIEDIRNAILWDGRDMSGMPIASGIYYYRLNSPTFKSGYSRMILMK